MKEVMAIIRMNKMNQTKKALADAGRSAPMRLAISESLVSDANINDARAAMTARKPRATNGKTAT